MKNKKKAGIAGIVIFTGLVVISLLKDKAAIKARKKRDADYYKNQDDWRKMGKRVGLKWHHFF